MRVLHVIGAMNRAGAETFLMNLYREIDRNRIQFDFLVHTDKTCDYDEEIQDLGGKIYRLPRYNVLNYHSYRKASESFFRAHLEHHIVHGHIGSSAPVYLREAKRLGRFTIAHSHSVTPYSTISNIGFNLIARPVKNVADYMMGCSSEAVINRFGKRSAQGDNCSVIQNGIITQRYHRSPLLASNAKTSLGLTDKPVFGHIGRFVPEKNHSFLIRIFQEIRTQIPDAMLILAGCGELEQSVRELVLKCGLDDAVRFLGVRSDIPDILRAMNVFLFPSINEGLGIALIEAQAAGLECIASMGVPESAILTDRATRISLSEPAEWVSQSVQALHRSWLRTDDCVEAVALHGYDMHQTAQLLADFYETHAQ